MGFVIGAVILIAAIVTLVVIFAVDATCPSNVMKCKECTSWMNVTGHPRNDTNVTVWHIEEICWEDLQWGNLTERQQTLWSELGQTQSTWDNDIQSARALNLCWDELDSKELTAATALGYRRETWNCTFQFFGAHFRFSLIVALIDQRALSRGSGTLTDFVPCVCLQGEVAAESIPFTTPFTTTALTTTTTTTTQATITTTARTTTTTEGAWCSDLACGPFSSRRLSDLTLVFTV